MRQSPIEEFLDAVDRPELDVIMALMASDARVLVVDGRRAEGTDAVRQLFADFLGQLRATTHPWRPDRARAPLNRPPLFQMESLQAETE